MKFEDNSNYESDVRYAVQVTKDVLGAIGVWPNSDFSTRKSLPTPLLKICCFLLLCFILVPGVLNTLLKETDRSRRVKSIGPLCGCAMALVKLCILCLREDRIKECLFYLQEDWRQVNSNEHRNTMMSKARIGYRIGILSVAFVYGSGFSYRIAILSRGSIVTPANITIRPLPLAAYFVVFDPQKSPAYEIVCLLQFVSGFVHYAITSGVFSLAALFILHACGQLKILREKMRDVTEEKHFENASAEEKLIGVVQHHMRIKSFLEQVESVLQSMCFIEIGGTTLIMCLVGYYIISEWENSNALALVIYSMLLSSFIFNIFILCFIGELLTDQGMKVFVTSCTLDWYRIPHRTARSLTFIIVSSSYPMKITAGKMFDLSLNTFLSIVRTSVAYFNILRTVLI